MSVADRARTIEERTRKTRLRMFSVPPLRGDLCAKVFTQRGGVSRQLTYGYAMSSLDVSKLVHMEILKNHGLRPCPNPDPFPHKERIADEESTGGYAVCGRSDCLRRTSIQSRAGGDGESPA